MNPFELSEQELDKMFRQRLSKVKSRDLNFELGYLLGEQLADDLPCLDIDYAYTKRIIHVDEDEFKTVHDLENKVAKMDGHPSMDDNSAEYVAAQNEVRSYRKMLMEKYLPKEFSYTFYRAVNITDTLEFRKGIGQALWDSDISRYSEKPEHISSDYIPPLCELKITVKLDLSDY